MIIKTEGSPDDTRVTVWETGYPGAALEQAAARIRELAAERDAAWNDALEEAAGVALEEPPDSHDSWEYAKQIAAAIRKLKRETRE